MANRLHPVSTTGRFTDMTHEVVRITPAMAREWLAANTHNRNIRTRTVAAYARDIADGNWVLNGESIKFAADGTLLDGQHRLHAIVKADTAVKSLVVRGLPVTAQNTMDTGTTRKFGDQLNLASEAAPQILASILRKITLWEAGFYMKTGTLKPTFAEMSDTLNSHPRVRECAVYGTKHAKASSIHASTVGFAHWLLGGTDYEDATWFLDRACDGIGLGAGHPVLVLRERVRRERDTSNGQVNPDVVLALIIIAWNAYRGNRKLQKLQLPKDGLTNDTFPQPK